MLLLPTPPTPIPHTIAPIAWNAAAQWVDCDNDGDLDLFVTGVSNRPMTRLYLNNGAGVFTDSDLARKFWSASEVLASRGAG